jgi:Cu(I)/Ag(I) efflux system membrane fusion protein
MDLERVNETGTVEGVEGYASFVLPARRQQLIGVSQGKVSRRPMMKIVRAAGRVTFDPDLATAIEEYRQAAAGGSGAVQDSPDAQRLRNRLLQSIAARLKLLGLTQAQINELPGRTGPTAEFVTGTNGGNVEVFLDIFPSDLGAVQAGQRLEARTLAAPGRVFRGVINAVDRNVNPTTRTVRARALIENSEGLLRTDTYLDVQISALLGMRLCVPADAILESGEKSLAFVISGTGKIDPRPVSIGQRGDDEVEILTGLAEGESVVTSANFLIDSESRLRSALAAFGGVAQPQRD